jgi:hypothetical protein
MPARAGHLMYHALRYYISKGYGWQRALQLARVLVGRTY